MLTTLRNRVAPYLRPVVRRVRLMTGRHGLHPGLKGRGTVQDLYYWVADGRIDTNILLNNFFSPLFPHLNTATTGRVTVYSSQGQVLGETDVRLSHLQCVKLTLSKLLAQWRMRPVQEAAFGSVLFRLAIPSSVLQALEALPGPFYFWHRFYIEYVCAIGQPAFAHCLDKTVAYRQGSAKPVPWYAQPSPRDWAPEIPLNIVDYRSVQVILINRLSRSAPLTLKVADVRDQSKTWTATVPSYGVHRFELTPEALRELDPRELRLRAIALPTPWARPVLFKEFRNGTISVMHC